ncbi:MAG: addiction module protein [Opitutaceae bacterium]|nr:addiction module protein [Opitutaceae bacterium]
MGIADIMQLLRSERHSVMEQLWDSLCREAQELESPAWHEKVLAGRKARMDSPAARWGWTCGGNRRGFGRSFRIAAPTRKYPTGTPGSAEPFVHLADDCSGLELRLRVSRRPTPVSISNHETIEDSASVIQVPATVIDPNVPGQANFPVGQDLASVPLGFQGAPLLAVRLLVLPLSRSLSTRGLDSLCAVFAGPTRCARHP